MRFPTFANQIKKKRELPMYVLQVPKVAKGKVYERGILYCGNEVIDDLAMHFGPLFKQYWFIVCTTQSHVFGDSPMADLHLFSNRDLVTEYLQSPAKQVPYLLIGCGHFVDPEVFYPDAAIKKSIDVIYVAKWYPTKRLELMLGAAEILGHKVRMRLIGIPILSSKKSAESKKYEEKILHTIRAKNLNIEVLQSPGPGHVNSDGSFVPGGFQKNEMRNFFNQAKLALLTADRNEGINRSICEALCCDVPAVMTKDMLGGTKELATPKTGLLVEPAAASVAAGIERALSVRSTFKPRQEFLKTFGTTNAMNTLKKAIQNVLDHNHERIDLSRLRPYHGDIWSMDYYTPVEKISYV